MSDTPPRDDASNRLASNSPDGETFSWSPLSPSEPTEADAGVGPGLDPERPRQRLGRYELLVELGRGGMGVVYLAHDTALRREVALKVLNGGALATRTSRMRFEREARAAARIAHPNIIRVFDFGEEQGLAWFTMERIEGPSLAALIRRGPLSAMDAARIALGLAEALQHLHDLGLIHRDVKPANVLMRGGVEPVLTDFGLVRPLEEQEATLTAPQQVLGTPAYMAPEQLLGTPGADAPAADQFALGVVLCEMLTGTRPYAREGSLPSLIRALPDERLRPMKGVPEGLARVLRRTLRPEPADRYPDLRSLAEDLARVARGEVVNPTTPQTRPMRRLTRWITRETWAGAALLAVCALALLAVGRELARALDCRAREASAEAARVAMERDVATLLAADQMDEANAAFEAYVTSPESQQTAAAALAWRHHGARLEASQMHEEALDAYALASVDAPDDGDLAEALLAFARLAEARQEWSGLSAALARLNEAHVPEQRRGELQDLRCEVEFAELDLTRAATSCADPGRRAIFAALTHATRTPYRARDAYLWRDAPGGAPALALLGTDTVTLVAPELPRLPTRQVLSLPDGVEAFRTAPVEASHGAPPTLLYTPGPARLLQLTAEGWTSLPLSTGMVEGHTQGDADGDGVPELYLGVDTELLRLRPEGAQGWLEDHPTPTIDAARSYVRGVALSDLDSDGRNEIVTASGGWLAYDLRVFQPDSAGGLTQRARLRLGETERVALLRDGARQLIATVQRHDPRDPLNRHMFGPDLPHSAPRGVHILAWRDDRLEPVALLPLPEPPAGHLVFSLNPVVRLLACDLDGDGRSELVAQLVEGPMMLASADAAGIWRSFVAPGISPLWAGQLDEDPAEELIVRIGQSGAIWVLGAGDDRLPTQTFAAPTVQRPPRDVSGEARELWSIAEGLMSLDRAGAAKVRLLDLARATPGTAVATAARMRAAQLLEEAGLCPEALPLYRALIDQPETAAAAWEGRMRCAAATALPDEALEAARHRVTLPDPPAQVRELLSALGPSYPRPTLEFDLDQELAPEWQVRTPVGVRSLPDGGGLRVDLTDGQTGLRLPVHWDGGPLRIEVDLDLERLDFASVLRVGLQRPDRPGWPEPAPDLMFSVYGGGGVGGEVFGANRGTLANFTRRNQGELSGRRLTVSLTAVPKLGKQAYELAGSRSLDGRRTSRWDLNWGPGPLYLVIEGVRAQIVGLSSAVIHRISLSGLTLRAEEPDAISLAYRDLALDRPDEALARLPSADARAPDWLALQALALDALGRDDEAQRALVAALRADPTLSNAWSSLVLQGGRNFDLRAADLPISNWNSRMMRTIEAVARSHADHRGDPLVLTVLRGIEDQRLELLSDEELAAAHTLLLARARAQRRDGRLIPALRDLQHLAAAAQILLGRPTIDADLRAEVYSVEGWAARERAIVELLRGETEAAMATVLASLARSLAPDIDADATAAAPELRPLRTHADWARVERARLGLPFSSPPAPRSGEP